MNPYTKYNKTDEYPDYNVPDEDIETCLKVIRTIRNACIASDAFDADGAVILSHAHAKIIEMAERCWDENDGIDPDAPVVVLNTDQSQALRALLAKSKQRDYEDIDKMKWLNGPQHILNEQLKYWKEFIADMERMGNDPGEFTEDQLRGRYEEWRDNEP